MFGGLSMSAKLLLTLGKTLRGIYMPVDLTPAEMLDLLQMLIEPSLDAAFSPAQAPALAAPRLSAGQA